MYTRLNDTILNYKFIKFIRNSRELILREFFDSICIQKSEHDQSKTKLHFLKKKNVTSRVLHCHYGSLLLCSYCRYTEQIYNIHYCTIIVFLY